MASNLVKLLLEGKTYDWVLRHCQGDDLSPARIREIRKRLAEDGIDLGTLAVLRQLDPCIARSPYPSLKRLDHTQYYFFPIPAFDIEVFFSVFITEHGLELGSELFPKKVDWQFGHREVQYCIGGEVKTEIILPDNTESTRTVRVGDVVAAPAGANFITHSSEEGGRFGHAHIFLVNEGEVTGRIYYDVAGTLRLQTLGLIDPAPGQQAIPFSNIRDRIQVKNCHELLNVHGSRERDLPTWLRNGWERREEMRALDYVEGTKRVVLTSPDRKPSDFIEWGKGVRKCFVNPLVSEQTAAVSDCHFPAGYRRLHTHQELWTILQGQARIKQSVPPLHSDWVEVVVQENDVMVAAGSAHIQVLEATPDFVVRRMAESCARNQHWAMMEMKLQLDGVPQNL
jgi:cupin superfamily acireductone dioxygenase involved in methionine salvage